MEDYTILKYLIVFFGHVTIVTIQQALRNRLGPHLPFKSNLTAVLKSIGWGVLGVVLAFIFGSTKDTGSFLCMTLSLFLVILYTVETRLPKYKNQKSEV